MDVREKYVMQNVNRKEKSICPNCIHHNLCIAENNQPCFECNRFIDTNGATVQEWISVKDRLPESEKDAVMIALRWGEVDIGWCEDEKWGSEFVNEYEDGEVTHWMPLPQPPKGE